MTTTRGAGLTAALRWVLLFFLCLPWMAARPAISRESLPPDLRDWTGWVLHGEEQKTCPFLFNAPDDHRCAWPTALNLSLDGKGGNFSQTWEVFADAWITLPGDARHWPLDVKVDGKVAPVSEHGGAPAVRLSRGRHLLDGRFTWTRLPESIPVPRESGIVQLRLDGAVVASPDLDESGRLWLSSRGTGSDQQASGDRLGLVVYRRVVDDIPLQVTTRMELDVSGAQREVSLSGALLAGFIPMSLTGPLPARLEADGRLRIQVRPGHWVLELGARYPSDARKLTLGPLPAPWPGQEVWVFDARNQLRLVEVQGPVSVEPRQTSLPPPWQQLPAYLMQAGSVMNFKVIRRGDPEPEPDNLSLQRSLWLDFDGQGYTLRDSIGGTVTRGWRLEMNPPVHLGRVVLDGQPQFITTLGDTDRQGIEIRRGQLDLEADSRIDVAARTVPAVGWNDDFQNVHVTLNLPPGWDLFSASGADNVPDTWLNRWTLLDIFLVLIAALAVRGLWNWKAGLLALLTLGLLWHEPGAPHFVWLSVLAGVALKKVLPPGRFQLAATAYLNLSLLALVLISVPFMINEVRTGLFPQLERSAFLPYPPAPAPVRDTGQLSGAANSPVATAKVMQAPMSQTAAESFMARKSADVAELKQARSLEEVDPDARVQTGPGIPDWQWKTIALSWNGPVRADQSLSLTLLSPAINLGLKLLRVIGVAALALVVFGVRFTPARGLHRAAGWLLLCLVPATLFHSRPVQADIPGPQLLDELKSRLLAPPECLPDCAQAPRLRVDLNPQALSLRVEIHALTAVAVPLPARVAGWMPEQVSLDGQPAGALLRGPDGTLWISVPEGVHQVAMAGPVPARNSFQLPLPLSPHNVEINAVGWSVDGIADGLPTGAQLQFNRQANGEPVAPEAGLKPASLPPFLRVERALRFGLNWTVHTRIYRASPSNAAVVAAVPLLDGESVTTDGVQVEQGRVLVNLSGRERAMQWDSTLEKSPEVHLSAPDTMDWTEIWRAEVSPIWHMTAAGIAAIHHQDTSGHWSPEWRPWPGEKLSLSLGRPRGVAGPVLTMDNVNLEVSPGKRAMDATLNIEMRSSQGGQHAVMLPEGVELRSVSINGAVQPIRQEGRSVTLPVTPGVQNVTLVTRAGQGIETRFRTPAFDLGLPSVNSRLHVSLGRDRWVLMLGGPRLGPAVLYWGVLIVALLIAAGLGRTGLTPLGTRDWVLLGIGLTQSSMVSAVIIVGWLLALGARQRVKPGMERVRFNLMQVGLFILTLLALEMIYFAVSHGLLGLPEMQVVGNQSSAYDLHWYQDRSAALMPRAWIFSVSIWVYRAMMLAWALWLAFALLSWLRWAWTCFSGGGYWKSGSTLAAAGR